MKFFDRFFGRKDAEEERPNEKTVSRDFREQEHISKALAVVLSLHQEKKTGETLMSVLRCLMENPPIWVPMTDGRPDIIQGETKDHYLPVFTSMDQVTESYRQSRQWEQLPFLELKPFLTGTQALSGILINGLSHEFILHRMTFPMFFEPANPGSQTKSGCGANDSRNEA